ncbi:HAMP domain-containing histidine kinase [Chloroflexia bacterium SDU3-3]|nr:HAMP domain-containing histidine kinase [Chloroflexia bacterium SDU3-3]
MLLTYALHVRGHYEERDQLLLTSAAHAASETGGHGAALHLGTGAGGLEVALRLYDASGELIEVSPGAGEPPPTDPRALLAAPSGPAFDWLAGLAPALAPTDAGEGSFGVVVGEQRWRTYALPLHASGHTDAYLVAMAPLGRLDASMASFRLILAGLGGLGLLAAAAGSWAIAAQALRPIDAMVATARTITQARDLSHRIPEPPARDELRRLSQTFNAMLTSLEEASRTQQRFVADASHELRAPLTAIQGNLELLRRQAVPPTERDEVLAEVEREAARLGRLVSDLLALARADAGQGIRHGPVDLDALTLEAFHTARAMARGQRLALDPFEPVQVAGDADRLRQLLLILLDNALKYTPPDGAVTLGLRQRGAHAELSVRDTGPGIADEDLPHVFERFYRADPARGRDPGGTGLGLAIARWIVEQHGGTIELRGAAGGGTLAMVRLPLGEEEMSQPR